MMTAAYQSFTKLIFTKRPFQYACRRCLSQFPDSDNIDKETENYVNFPSDMEEERNARRQRARDQTTQAYRPNVTKLFIFIFYNLSVFE